MKQLVKISLIILFLMVFANTQPVWAATISGTPRLTQAAEKQATALQTLIARADTMITTRIASLQELLTRIQNDTRLSPTDKTMFTNNINTTIASLQALKTKIDADTDLATARADTKSIITSFHVYVTFEPQLRLLLSIDNLLATAAVVQGLVPSLQNLSTSLKGLGQNTTAIDAAIADITTQLTNINTLLTTDKTTLSAVILTNANYQATFTAIRKDLASVHADFAQIRHDLATIKGDVSELRPTIKPTITCLPRPACLDAKPKCMIVEPLGGWCKIHPTITAAPTTASTATPTP